MIEDIKANWRPEDTAYKEIAGKHQLAAITYGLVADGIIGLSACVGVCWLLTMDASMRGIDWYCGLFNLIAGAIAWASLTHKRLERHSLAFSLYHEKIPGIYLEVTTESKKRLYEIDDSVRLGKVMLVTLTSIGLVWALVAFLF